MLKRFIALLLCCCALPAAFPADAADALPEVIFVYGWSGDKRAPDARPALEKIFPGYRITLWGWDARSWRFPKAETSAEAEAVKLAGELAKLPREEREKIILVGHSLGARIVIKAMARLSESELYIDRGIFLGAAIPDDDPAIAAAITASRRSNINIYHPQDNALRHGYELRSFSSPLGVFGYAFECRKSRLFQICAGEYEDARQWGKTLDLHDGIRYLRTLADNIGRVDRESTDEMDDSTARAKITIPETVRSADFPIPRGLPLISKDREEIIDRHGKWELVKFRTPRVDLGAKEEDAEKNGTEKEPWWKRMSVHIPEYTFFVIRDPRDRILGWTTDRQTAENAFAEVKRQLKKLPTAQKNLRRTVRDGVRFRNLREASRQNNW